MNTNMIVVVEMMMNAVADITMNMDTNVSAKIRKASNFLWKERIEMLN